MVYVIGITGGIGAGKSTVTWYLKREYGARVVITDMVGAKMMEPGGSTYDAIVNMFGESILLSDGHINKAALASVIYSNEEARKKLNSVVHPEVVNYIKSVIESERLESIIDRGERKRIVVIESALLFEGGANDLCDEIWYVATAKDIRIARLMNDRGYTREKSQSIIASQKSDEYYRDRCDRVIVNDAEESDVYLAVDEAMKTINDKGKEETGL